jgi:hypothetical protein
VVPCCDGSGVSCGFVVLFSPCHCWLGGFSSVLVFATPDDGPFWTKTYVGLSNKLI